MDLAEDDAVDGDMGGNEAASSMSEGDIQQLLRQFNSKYGKSKNAGVLTHSFIYSFNYIFTFIQLFIRLVYFMWENNQQLQKLVKL